MTTQIRIEKDSMGVMEVPGWALWGASTQRAVENFPVSGRGIPAEVVHAFGLLKAACAAVNRDLGKLEPRLASAIIAAAEEVAAGAHDRHFVVDVYQTGSGTSSNMNANEVIANLANLALGGAVGSQTPVHPNDHVNMGQSSNDTFPTAMHVAGAVAVRGQLVPALERLHRALSEKAAAWDDVIKIGRTHLMDATPIRLGQVFGGYAAQAEEGLRRADAAVKALLPLAIGGTAVGTGINTHPEMGARVAAELARRTGVPFTEAKNHPEAQAAKDAFVESMGLLKVVAVSLSKIANDLRWLGSGPRCGLFELSLPAIQPGSSIMPGKVNPVICESVIQVAARVLANDLAVTVGGLGGVGSLFELNVAMPLMADAYLESVTLLSRVTGLLVDKLLDGLEVNRERVRALMESSLMLVTAVAPALGYDTAAHIAKRAFSENRTVRELILEQGLLPAGELDRLLEPRSMTEPGE